MNECASTSSTPDVISLPIGYRFLPRNYEILFHLHYKINNGASLIQGIRDVELYKHHPKTLTETYLPVGEKEWYFFTSRNRKYPNGLRPDRSVVGTGYWKATGADEAVAHEGQIIGYKRSLLFMNGKHGTSIPTNWNMHEFRVEQKPKTKSTDANHMKLDDWVLCKVYEKATRLKKHRQEDVDDHNSQAVVEVEEINTQIDQTVDNSVSVAAATIKHDYNGSDVVVSSSFMMSGDVEEDLTTLIIPQDCPPSLEEFFGPSDRSHVAGDNILVSEYVIDDVDFRLGSLVWDRPMG